MKFYTLLLAACVFAGTDVATARKSSTDTSGAPEKHTEQGSSDDSSGVNYNDIVIEDLYYSNKVPKKAVCYDNLG